MTPEEKAQELVLVKFKYELLEQAKQYSFILVDEVIKACEYNNVDWWNKVRNEIEKI